MLSAGLMLAAALAVAPSDEGMFPFVIRPDAKGTAMDMSGLLVAPAGKNGFLRRDGEHLVDGEGHVVRLNGVNLTGRGNYPSHDEADRLATHFARLGINCVRMHYFDTDAYANLFQDGMPCLFKKDAAGRLVIDETMRDRQEYLIAALKRRGIYVNINIHAARQLGPADGVPRTAWANRGTDFYNPKLIAEQKAFSRDFLTHVNPYTGLALANDPTMALLEINNENALMQVWWSNTLVSQKADPCYIEEFHRLREAAGYANTTNGITKFVIETEQRYFRTMVDFMKSELGVKCPCVGTQQDYTAPWVTAETCDVVDSHIYWNHPGWEEPKGTDGRQGRVDGTRWHFRNCSIVDAEFEGDYCNPVVYRAARRVKGRPFITSECASPYPCWYGAEFQPFIHAYGAFQDWSGIFAYSWNNADVAFPDYSVFFFSYSSRSDCIAHFPASAALFLRGDVAKARQRLDVPVDRDWLMAETAKKGSYTPLVMVSTGKCLAVPVAERTILRHAVSVDLSPAPGTRNPEEIDLPSPEAAHVSDTGEIFLEPTANSNGVFTVNAPNVKVLSGHTDGRCVELGGVVFEPGKTKLGWSTVSLVSQNAKGFTPGSRLLLAATGYTHNGGAVFHKQDGVKWGGVSEELGTGKVVTEGVPLKVTLPVGAAKCWALDEAGVRKGEVSVAVRDGKVEISVGPEYKTVWYEIAL